MTATQEELAALAALVGITPDSHRGCVNHNYNSDNPNYFVENLPALDTDAGDDVFFAPMMRWCTAIDKPHGYFASVRFVPQMCGGWYCFVDAFVADSIGRREHEAFGDSQTLALLRACQSAGVPEIVAIFGRGDHDAR